MNLRRRRKRKQDQALDAVASVTKLWSEWQLGKRVAKGAEKAKDLRPPGKLKRILSLKWVRIGGAAAVAGGTAAAVGRKLKGSDPADYEGPAPSVAADAAVPSPDSTAPLSVAPDPATQERSTETVGGPSTLRANREPAAPVPSSEKPAEHAEEFVEAFTGKRVNATVETARGDAEPPDAEAEPAADAADAEEPEPAEKT